jgi:hypothetical protein
MYLESNPYSTRAQVIMILLATMHSLMGGHSKRMVISEIESRKWFDRRLEDNTPYPSAKEARWKTLVAFRREDCYEEELFLRDGVHDSWQMRFSGARIFLELSADRERANAHQDGRETAADFHGGDASNPKQPIEILAKRPRELRS